MLPVFLSILGAELLIKFEAALRLVLCFLAEPSDCVFGGGSSEGRHALPDSVLSNHKFITDA
jgi:hypothetical protein